MLIRIELQSLLFHSSSIIEFVLPLVAKLVNATQFFIQLLGALATGCAAHPQMH